VLAEHGTSEVAQAILDRTFDPTTLEMDEGIETFIRGLQRQEKEKSLTMPRQMTTEEFQESIKVTHEDTSSSASGLHYTLGKAIAEDEDLSATHAIMISLPFMYGFVCERWRKIIDCMLEKKAGVQQIHIMRISYVSLKRTSTPYSNSISTSTSCLTLRSPAFHQTNGAGETTDQRQHVH
jgi:hypothetical protein